MSQVPRPPNLPLRNQSQPSDSALRPSWSQVLIIFVCSIPAAAIVTGLATWLFFEISSILGLKEGDDSLYLLMLVLSPAGFVVKLLHPRTTGWDNLNLLFYSFVADFLYYFCLVFLFSLWADKRWRRKRGARIDA